MFSDVFENRGAYEIMWTNILESDVLQVTILHMRSAC